MSSVSSSYSSSSSYTGSSTWSRPATPVSLWIGGKARTSVDAPTFEVRNPLTREVVGRYISAAGQDCRDAIAAAASAQASWEATPTSEKQAIFVKAASLFQSDDYREKLIQAMKEETACTHQWAGLNIGGSIAMIMGAIARAGEATKKESFLSEGAAGGYAVVQRRAYGVVLAFAPAHAPVILTVRAILIPLICGNTVVFKSSCQAPRSQKLVLELMHEAGIPPGVLNFISITEDNSHGLVKEMIANPLVRILSYTGGDKEGQAVAVEAARHLKPYVIEVGGKSPAIVLQDADLEAAARCIANGALMNTGQLCMSTERLIVMRSISTTLTNLIKAHFKEAIANNKDVDSVSEKFTPLLDEASAQRVLGMLREAQKSGAEVLVGDLQCIGTTVQPHLVSGVKPGCRMWEEESFGPILGIVEVDTVEDAVQLANQSDYSLAASLWTKDVNNAFDIASRIKAGCTSINGSTFHLETGFSHAGFGGSSGHGRFDVDHFTIKKMVVLHPCEPSRT